MAKNLSIKNVPDGVAEALRARANRNHRSLQKELMVILEQAVAGPEPIGPAELLAELRRDGLSTPAEAVEMIRADRESR